MHRPFKSDLPPPFLAALQKGVMKTAYRGVLCHKSPFDLVLYTQLIGKQRPRTVIEIGTKFGGSALWFADILTAHGIESPRIVSVDIKPMAQFADPRITFLKGEAQKLGDVFTGELLAGCARPFLVVEDSSHMFEDSLAVLEFFHPFLRGGDYIVVEDGVVSLFEDPKYRRYEDGPNRAVDTFFKRHVGEYTIDADLCDFFGMNVTYNPNGWLKKI